MILLRLSTLILCHQALSANSWHHDTSTNGTVASVMWQPKKGFWIESGSSASKHCVGQANYQNAVNATGWAFLELETSGEFSDVVQAYGAGYLEGWVTSSLLFMQYQNTVVGRCDGKEALCEKITKWVHDNHHWVRKKVKHHRRKATYWHHVGLFYDQLEGLYKGYKASAKGTERDVITYEDILTMNIFGDLEDLESVFATKDQEPAKVRGVGHCSALVRLLPNNTDLYVSHDTWNSYQSMLRILKKYKMPLKKVPKGDVIAGIEMSFSGYPGVIYSGDDFTITSSGLTILETTIGNSNPELWQFVKPHGSVLEGIRATVASRLATDGMTWTNIFSKWNSGTYNNQWMVVDNKLFTPGQTTLSKGLFWVLEQIPNFIHKEDLTSVLSKKTFWPSYNSPYFQDVFNKSGNYDLMLKLGDWFSYDRTPRALIFARDVPQVSDIPSMIKLMRYNDYTKDPLSACNCTPAYSAENAISARCDLNPRNGTYPFGALGHRSHGGTDMKLTTSALASKLQFIAQSGPTWDPLPPFRWSEQDFLDTPHVGHPDLWQFAPVIPLWNNLTAY
eukprot:GFUD01010629.1.p1 GENE.GFUD01010629.1~~GFUD01010629.1.p1  ORF type:complete len:562 (-),score=106.79 GFUD01010629.1:392-2077(-)